MLILSWFRVSSLY